MVRTIIKNAGNLLSYPKILLKLDYEFKKLGFKEVNIDRIVRLDDFFKELTLFITSNFESSTTKYIQETKLYRALTNLQGHYYYSDYIHTFKSSDTDRVKFILDDTHIGDYFPSRNLVILYYKIHKTQLSEKNNQALEYILKNFIKFIKEAKIKKVNVKEAIRRNLIEKYLLSVKNQISNLVTSTNQAEESVRGYRENIATLINTITQNKKMIESLSLMLKELGGALEKKIEEIKKLPFVTKVNLSSRGIRVDIKKVYITHNKEKVEIGEFYIYLLPNSIKIYNKTPIKLRNVIQHHPHIEEETICFGEGKEKAYELLGELKLKELVYFLYLYLKTYNPDDNYSKIEDWKKIREGETIEEEGEGEEYYGS